MKFEVVDSDWQEIGDKPVLEWFTAFLRDIGTGLDTSLYEEALTHLLGGKEQALRKVEVVSGGTVLGPQKFRLVTPDVALKITAFHTDPVPFEIQTRRLLEHTSLEAVQWINVARNKELFRTIRK
ncbi:MAG TPA: hypothetical protein VJ810_11230 [Blastocatellia bacterium]|nr:hypothetical protein [Blastocatellia bacterium]